MGASPARRAFAVFAILVSAAIGLSLASVRPAEGQGPPFLTQSDADQRYVQRLWVEVEADGQVVNASNPGITVERRSTGFYVVSVPGGGLSGCAATASLNADLVLQESLLLAGSTGDAIAWMVDGTRAAVATADIEGVRADRFFTLQILC